MSDAYWANDVRIPVLRDLKSHLKHFESSYASRVESVKAKNKNIQKIIDPGIHRLLLS